MSPRKGSNSAKKSARDRMSETGEPYMQSARASKIGGKSIPPGRGASVEDQVAYILSQHLIMHSQDGNMWEYRDGMYSLTSNQSIDFRWALGAMAGSFQSARVLEIRRSILLNDSIPELGVDVPNAQLINMKNGVVKIGKLRLRPHAPKYRFISRIEVDWEPDAACPIFDAWLALATEPDAAEYIWEIIGYMMLSGNPFHKAVVLHDVYGASDTSRLEDVLKSMSGRSSKSGNLGSYSPLNSVLKHDIYTGYLFGEQFSRYHSPTRNEIAHEGRMEALVGRSSISGKVRRGRQFNFVSHAKPVFKVYGSKTDVSSGSRPFRYGEDILPIRFSMVDSLDIPMNLQAPPEGELEGIAVKAMFALGNLMERGHFILPESSKLSLNRLVSP